MRRAAAPDVPRLLGLTGPGAWALVALFWVTYLVLVAFSGNEPMQTVEGWIALVLTLLAAVVVVLPGPYPLRMPIVLGVLGVVAFSTVAIVWHLHPWAWPGWTSWSFGSNTFLLFMLALRGRARWGAVGVVVMMLLTLHWSWVVSGSIGHGFDLTYRQLATYFAGAFFALWLRRTARKIVEFHAVEERRIREEQALESGDLERDREVQRVRLLAGPALAAIATRRVSDDDRREHALLEARLRDGIRGRTLADDPSLAEAVRAARVRGARVALLDDLPRDGDPVVDPDYLAAARAWIVRGLRTLDAEDITVRVALADGRPVVTVATGQGGAESFSPPTPVDSSRAARDPRA